LSTTTNSRTKTRNSFNLVRVSPRSTKANSREYAILDLFCGTGGFSYGFAKNSKRLRVEAAIDNAAYATATTAANHPKCHVLHDDIRNIRPNQLAQVVDYQQIDLIIGGPPCQGFSSLRPFRSSDEDDPRNGLFENFALYVAKLRPRVFVMENVVGLLTFNQGESLLAIERCFNQLGYSTDWRVLNAANFGVPQKRERFIMIGRRDRGPVRFPIPTHAYTGKGIGYRDKTRMLVGSGDLPPALTVMDAIGDLPGVKPGKQATRYRKKPSTQYQFERRGSCLELTNHIATNHNAKLLEVIRYAGNNINSIPEGMVSSGFSSCYSRLRPNEPANTITVKFTSPASSKCIHPLQDRAITPREAARIQSFDDSFHFCGSKTDIALQIGNAVPPLLGYALAVPVLEMLDEIE
jgi:DNA (cytosine-5)-methyltransferase 1